MNGRPGLAIRAATPVATILALLLVTFALASLSPVDPALQMLGDHFSPQAYTAMRHTLGLDASWPMRFLRYLLHLAHGDLGISLSTGQSVSEDLMRVFPATLELATLAMLVSTAVGLALAVFGARYPHGAVDAVVRVVSLAGNSLPIFWLGLLALYLFYARLHWAGGPGRMDDAFEYTIDMRTGIALVDAWRSGVSGALPSVVSHLVLPVSILASYAIGNITRLTRAALLAETGKDYATLARATGATELGVILRHLLPNVAGFVLTVLALTYANLLEGAVLVETVFARPGLGRYLTTALFAADVPAILGSTLAIGICFVAINGMTDFFVKLADPRAR